MIVPFSAEALCSSKVALREMHCLGYCVASSAMLPGSAGTLSLFCTVTAAHSLLPAVLGAFRQRHPDVTIRLETGYAADALQRLQRSEVDVSVAALPDRVPSALLSRVIAHTPLSFIAHPS